MMILPSAERNGNDLSKIFPWVEETHCLVKIPEEKEEM